MLPFGPTSMPMTPSLRAAIFEPRADDRFRADGGKSRLIVRSGTDEGVKFRGD
jgi:hypothetical protein